MNRQQIRRAKSAIIALLYDALGDGYKLGRRGNGDPPLWDCRGLAEGVYIRAGVGEAMGGQHVNVRAEVRWAKAYGRLRGPEVKPAPCWWIIYNEPAKVGEPGNPDAIRHVAVVVEAPSEEHPEGLAISAFNPKRGVIEHGLEIKGYAIYGYVKPAFKLVGANDVPIVDPEPPIGEPNA